MNSTQELKFLVSVETQDGIGQMEGFQKSVGGLVVPVGEVKNQFSGLEAQINSLTKAIGGLPGELSKSQKTLGEFSKSSTEVNKETDQAQKKIGGLSEQIGALPAAFQKGSISTAAFTSSLASMAGEAAIVISVLAGIPIALSAVWAATKSASLASDSKQNFKALAESVGLNADEIISKINKVTNNSVSDAEIMKNASMSIGSQIRLTADQMGSLFEIAGVKGKQFDQQASSLFQSFISTMNSGMLNSIKQFGFTFSQEFENSIAKMSNMEKKQAILNEILRQGKEQVEKLRGKLGEASDGFEQMDTSIGRLKSAMQSWFVVLAPIAGTLASIVSKMAEFISIKDRFAALTIQELKKIREETQEMLNAEIERNLASTNARANFSNLRSDDPNFSAGGEYLSSEREQALKAEIKLLDEHTQKLEELEKIKKQIIQNDKDADAASKKAVESQKAAEDAKKKAEEAARKADEEYLKRLSAKADAEYEYQKAVTNTNITLGKITANSDLAKKALEGSAIAVGLFDPRSLKAVSVALGALPNIFSDIDKAVERVRLKLLQEAVSQYVAALREGKPAAQELGTVLDQSGQIMGSVMQAAGGMGGTVVAASRAMNAVSFEGIGKNLDALKKKVLGVGDAYSTWSIVMGAAGIGATGKLIPSDQIGKAVQGETDKLNDAEVKRIEEFAQKMRINVRDAFEQGLADAKNVNDFLENFGNNLKRQVQQALASALTQQIFNGSNGIFNIGSYLGSNSLENTPAVGSGINWGTLGTSVAVGAALSYLTSPGRLFGGTVQHGTEAYGNSSSLNEQVTNAIKARDELLVSAIGVSTDTLKALQDLQFSYTSVAGHNSGDGIFSKKTTTYEMVGGIAASDALKKYAELSAKAQAEATQHAFEISLTEITNPAKALDMTIQDLRTTVNKLGNTAEAIPYQLQLAQAEAKKRSNEISATGTWLDFALSSGSSDALSVAQRFVGQGSKPDDVVTHTVRGTPILFENDDGTYRSSSGQSWSVSNINPYKIGGQTMVDLYQAQAQKDFQLQIMQTAAGNDPTAQLAYLTAKKDSINEALNGYETLLNTIKTQLQDQSLSEDDSTRLFEQLKTVTTKYYASKNDLISIDLEMGDIMKAQAEEAAQAAEEAKQEAEAAAKKAEEDQKAALEAYKESISKTLGFQDDWLSLALNNPEVLTNQNYAYMLQKNIQSGTWTENSDTAWLPNEFALRKEGLQQSFNLEKMGLAAGDDSEKIKAYQDEQLKNYQAEKDFYNDLAAREEQNLLDRTKTYEEQRAHVERYFSAKKAANDAELKGLQIQKQQQDEITAKADELKAKQENMFYDLLGNLMTRVVQAQETKTGDTYNILAPGQTPAQRILEAMQATVNGKYPELAAVMKDIVAEFGGEYGI